MLLWTKSLGGKAGAAIVGALVAICLLDALHVRYGAVGEGLQVSWISTLARVGVFWFIYAALLPPLFLFASRYPLDVTQIRSALLHAVMAIGFCYLHLGLYALVTFILGPPTFAPDTNMIPRAFRLIRLNFSSDFRTYWTAILATSAVRYYTQLRERELAAARVQATLSEARLHALQSQLNPHFFLNTLNAISVLALRGDRESVVNMLGRLGGLVRTSLTTIDRNRLLWSAN
jgi:hypothetical protein